MWATASAATCSEYERKIFVTRSLMRPAGARRLENPPGAARSPLSRALPCLLSRGKEGSVEDGRVSGAVVFCVSSLSWLP